MQGGQGGGMESVGVGGDSPLHLVQAALGFPVLWHQSFKQCKTSGVFAMLEEPGELKILRMSNPRLPTLGEGPHSKGWELRQCPLSRGLITRILLSWGTTKVLLSFSPAQLLWAEQPLKTLKALFYRKHLSAFLADISCET